MVSYLTNTLKTGRLSPAHEYTYADCRSGRLETLMNLTRNPFTIHRAFIWIICISLAVGFMFLLSNNFDVLINGIMFGTLTFPNIVYWLLINVGTIILPLSFLIPTQNHIQRIQVIKYTYFVYGALYLLTLSWIVFFLAHNPIGELFSNESIIAFQTNDKAPMIASYALWGTSSWMGSLSSLIYGVLLIFVGINIDDEKYKPCLLMLTAMLLRPGLTIISNLICGNPVLSIYWIGNNYGELITLVTITLALFLAATFDSTWISLIWDHEVPSSPEDE